VAAEASHRFRHGHEQDRRTDIRVYRTDTGSYVVEQMMHTLWQKGDVILILRDLKGGIRGVVVNVHVAEPMTIAVLSPQWPNDLREGVRVDVKGQLCNEKVQHKRATHFLMAESIEVVHQHHQASRPERSAHVLRQ
jgi:hypothetical protein